MSTPQWAYYVNELLASPSGSPENVIARHVAGRPTDRVLAYLDDVLMTAPGLGRKYAVAKKLRALVLAGTEPTA